MDSLLVPTQMKREIRKVSKAFVSLRALLGLWLLAYSLVCLVPLSSVACGYHDTANTRQGMLNWAYHNCLHVRSEIWQAQALGKLPAYEAVTYQETEYVLKVLGSRFSKLNTDDQSQSFSVVLVETVLWSQFSHSGSQYEVAIDTEGPIVGELVVVTDEPVLYSVETEELSLSIAVESGLVKLYGDSEQINNFLNVYGAIGEQPLASL